MNSATTAFAPMLPRPRPSKRRIAEAIKIGELLTTSAAARKHRVSQGRLAMMAASADLRFYRICWQMERAECKAAGKPKPEVFKRWMAAKIESWGWLD